MSHGADTQIVNLLQAVACVHAGLPLNLEFSRGMMPDWLAAAPSGARFGSVHLPDDPEGMGDEQWPPLPKRPPLVVSALAGSASTLAALHNLPLRKLPADDSDPEVGLAAFTQLRELSLRQIWHMDVLRAADLPASLEDFELIMNLADLEGFDWPGPPNFVAFDSHQNLRRITLAGFPSWKIGGYSRQRRRWRPALLPRSLEVCAPSPSRVILHTATLLPWASALLKMTCWHACRRSSTGPESTTCARAVHIQHRLAGHKSLPH